MIFAAVRFQHWVPGGWVRGIQCNRELLGIPRGARDSWFCRFGTELHFRGRSRRAVLGQQSGGGGCPRGNPDKLLRKGGFEMCEVDSLLVRWNRRLDSRLSVRPPADPGDQGF